MKIFISTIAVILIATLIISKYYNFIIDGIEVEGKIKHLYKHNKQHLIEFNYNNETHVCRAFNIFYLPTGLQENDTIKIHIGVIKNVPIGAFIVERVNV